MSLTLQQNIMDALKILAPRDRDIRTIVITINPNYSNGSDTELQTLVHKELKTMIKLGLVKKNRLECHILIGCNNNYKTAHRIYTIYTLNIKF